MTCFRRFCMERIYEYLEFISLYIVKWLQVMLIILFNISHFGLVGRVFSNGPGDLGSIPCHVIQKT